jgi:hypothetical protein
VPAHLHASPTTAENGPTGKSLRAPREALSSPILKNILIFRNTQISLYSRHPVPHRGALRNVTSAGRAAVDADGATDERA